MKLTSGLSYPISIMLETILLNSSPTTSILSAELACGVAVLGVEEVVLLLVVVVDVVGAEEVDSELAEVVVAGVD